MAARWDPDTWLWFERPPAFTGRVIRRDPASYQERSVHLTWRCPSCRNWTMHGAHAVGRCNWCGKERPAA